MPISAASQSAQSILNRIDGASSGRWLVFGSLPPNGRDVDLLVPTSHERDRVVARLRDEGFERFGDRWVDASAIPPTVVELVLADEWSLPPSEVAALFDEARPLPGLLQALRPAPVHVLLILARKNAWRRGISAKVRARLDAALAEDPTAWAGARVRALSWSAEASLGCLELAYSVTKPPALLRARAIREAVACAGGGSVARGAATHARRILERRRGALVTLSGLDGAGKSGQTLVLARTLDVLGRDAVVVWSPLGSTGAIAVLGRWGKRFVGRLPSGGASATPERISEPAAEGCRPSDVSAAQRRVVAPIWVTLMGTASVLSRLKVGALLLLGRDVVCDRYSLDAAVHLLQRFGRTRAVRIQIALIKLASPTPRRAFFLEVQPEVAAARKTDRWSEAELRVRADLYRKLHGHFGVICVDGEQSPERVSTEIIAQTLEGLRSL